MEEQQSEVQHAALDYDKSGQFKEHRSSTKYFVLDEAQSKEHTFAVEWTPEELIFYTDGKVTRRVNRKDDPKQVPSAYQMVYFSCSAGEWGGNVMEIKYLPMSILIIADVIRKVIRMLFTPLKVMG